MIQMDENLKGIFFLNSIIEKVFFREFVGNYQYPEGLNHTHIKTMMLLKFEGERQMSEVSDLVNLGKGSFTPVACKLIELGYIEKIRDIEDKRVFNLKLTEKGNEFACDFAKTHIKFIEKKLESLTEEEKQVYFASIELINTITKKLCSE
jgi:DNA-binding MarR family transcriptional regulator